MKKLVRVKWCALCISIVLILTACNKEVEPVKMPVSTPQSTESAKNNGYTLTTPEPIERSDAEETYSYEQLENALQDIAKDLQDNLLQEGEK